MVETHVVSALRLKRAEISGHIHDLEKRIARQRIALANLDATIRLFSPSTNPDLIPAKRPYRCTRYFAHDELPRLVMDALRLATGPLAAPDIATAVMRAKGAAMDDDAFKAIVTERALGVLRGLAKRGGVVRLGTSRNAQWTIAPSLL
ncbi:MAG TPA: hypothetical protein VHT02_03770 [Methylocella sp.]|jgi:hypothetical protein|nr:hypothetical protein [Methylocella sp.]